MVIIGVIEGYREAGLVAMRFGCAERRGVVENVWNARFMGQNSGVVPRGVWKSFVPRGTNGSLLRT